MCKQWWLEDNFIMTTTSYIIAAVQRILYNSYLGFEVTSTIVLLIIVSATMN